MGFRPFSGFSYSNLKWFVLRMILLEALIEILVLLFLPESFALFEWSSLSLYPLWVAKLYFCFFFFNFKYKLRNFGSSSMS